MWEETKHDFPNPSASGQFGPCAALKRFLRHLNGKRASRHKEDRKKARSSTRRKKDLLAKSAWLNYCCDRALDASSLAEALLWHKSVVHALTGIIDSVAGNEWRDERKRQALLQLMHQRALHNRYVLNIEVAMRRDEIIDWMQRPQRT